MAGSASSALIVTFATPDVVVSSHRRSMTDQAVRAHPRFDDATAVWRSGARRDPGEIPTRRIA
jgi:hypothetical protein